MVFGPPQKLEIGYYKVVSIKYQLPNSGGLGGGGGGGGGGAVCSLALLPLLHDVTLLLAAIYRPVSTRLDWLNIIHSLQDIQFS